MPATQAQYDAAMAVITAKADAAVASLPWLEQGPAKEFLASDDFKQMVYAGVDAAVAVTGD
jgi:hypothetical protein